VLKHKSIEKERIAEIIASFSPSPLRGGSRGEGSAESIAAKD
jgi:hypothetical protein